MKLLRFLGTSFLIQSESIMWLISITVMITITTQSSVFAQDWSDPRWQMNLDSAAIAPYELPDPMVFNDGTRVTTIEEWENQRRPEILNLLENTLFGMVPSGEVRSRTEILSHDPTALNGKALRREIRIHLATEIDSLQLDVLIYTPVHTEGSVPTFLGLNYFGNHTIGFDPDVQVGQGWVENYEPFGIDQNRSNERSRGSVNDRWPVEDIISRGYGVVTATYGEIDPDYHDEFKNGVHALFQEPEEPRAPDAWGSLAAWAWGLSRIMDILETDSIVDPTRVALIGHSRLGRTAAWAGARDPRFAMVIANNGLGALFKRNYGETYWQTINKFPHWFADAAKSYENSTADLPVDNHLTLALIAPRPFYLGTASQDVWANPTGEFLAAKAAEPVWRLYGLDVQLPDESPQPGTALKRGPIGFHVRDGLHSITPWDWAHYLDFADLHLKGDGSDN